MSYTQIKFIMIKKEEIKLDGLNKINANFEKEIKGV